MSEGLNKVFLQGNLGIAPELRYTQSGTAVLSLRLATNERVRRGEQWEDHTEWHNVTVWGRRAEALERLLRKGSSLLVEGKLRTSSYDDRDGNKRYKTEIHASEVILTGGGSGDDRGRRDDRRDDRRRDDRRDDRGRRDDRRSDRGRHPAERGGHRGDFA